MNMGETLKKRIFELTIKYNKTFYELSKISGIPKSTIRKIASGKSKNPNLANIEKIAIAFALSLYDFFDDELFR